MRVRSTRFLCLVLAALGLSSCGGAVRVCTGCKYKSQVNFSGLPTGTISSAQMRITVKHAGACPQSAFPDNCTEELIYNVKCKLGSSSNVTIPFFIDAATTVTSHTAKITAVKAGVTSEHTGTVNMSSNVTGGGPPPSSMPTPCPPPSLNPYSTTVPTVLP